MNKSPQLNNSKEDVDAAKIDDQTNTITLEKIESKTPEEKSIKVKKIIENNHFTTAELKKHKLNKSSIYLAILGAAIVIGLIIGLLAWSFTN